MSTVIIRLYIHIYIYSYCFSFFVSVYCWFFLHVCCIPHQNSQWLFWASVWFMLDSSRWHEPFGECFSKQNVDVTTRCLNLHFWISNSFKYSETVVQFPASHRSVEWALKQLAAVCLQFFQMIRLTVTVSLQPWQPFQYCSSNFSCRQLQHEDSRHRPCLQVWWLLFLGRWWGSIVHVIHLNTDSRLWGWRDI